MNRLIRITTIATIGMFAATGIASAQPPHGAVRDAADAFEAYDASTGRWLSPESFWDAHVGLGRGRHWGRGAAYPPYADVAEFDTFIVEIDEGACLMEFFHQRWRRANDVRRWNDRFNTYGACARVFD
jgi:hypothetical protein